MTDNISFQEDEITNDSPKENIKLEEDNKYTKILPLITNYKKIKDVIHGYIDISNYALRIIDNKYFQHLRYKKQLGCAYLVFPNATHTRFEHSIGTYNFASKILNCIISKTKQSSILEYLSNIPYLKKYYKYKYDGRGKLDSYVCELVKIAALCHDIGHGPYSHLFDDVFLTSIYKNNTKIENINHEERSANLIKKIIKSDEILSKIILDDEIEFIQHLINPIDYNIDTGFLFQIVSNNLNGLDIDKYDYLIRDSKQLGFNISFNASRFVDDIIIVNNNICYPKQISLDIYNMFNLRYLLHKAVFNDPAVISFQLLIVELMKLIDNELKISESINNLDKFILLDDYSIFNFVKNYELLHINIPDNIFKAQKIIDKINTHDFYKHIDILITKNQQDISKVKELCLKNFDKKQMQFINDNLIIFKNKIGLLSGDKSNPLDNIFCYYTKSLLQNDIPEISKININDVSLLIPNIYQENIMIFYLKDSSNKKINNKLKDNIQFIRTLFV